MSPEDLGLSQDYFGDHALEEMFRPGISAEEVIGVLAARPQESVVRAGRIVVQALQGRPERLWVLRVFVDVDRSRQSS